MYRVYSNFLATNYRMRRRKVERERERARAREKEKEREREREGVWFGDGTWKEGGGEKKYFWLRKH